LLRLQIAQISIAYKPDEREEGEKKKKFENAHHLVLPFIVVAGCGPIETSCPLARCLRERTLGGTYIWQLARVHAITGGKFRYGQENAFPPRNDMVGQGRGTQPWGAS
jgi:hypothetical protein